jgi:hypothetical protein
MNWKTTLALLFSVLAGSALFFYGARLALLVVPKPPPDPATSPTLTVLEKELTPDALAAVAVRHGDRVVLLERDAGGAWSLPGNWPVRQPEVKQLVSLLTGLRSRFAPLPATHPEQYGLDRPAVTVTLRLRRPRPGPDAEAVAQQAGQALATLAGTPEPGAFPGVPLAALAVNSAGDYRLELGESPAPADGDKDENDDRSPFARPTYLRLAVRSGAGFAANDEVIRLAPGLVAALDRPVDYYQQRRLFPAEKVVKEGEGRDRTERLQARALAVQETKPDGSKFTLAHKGEDWQLSEPVADRVEPEKLKGILTAVPDIWAEQFVQPTKDLADYGLKEPEQTIRVTLPGGAVRELLVGKVSQIKSRPAPPGNPLLGQPPPPPPPPEEYRYAKLKDNDQVFEIRANRLKEVFVKLDDLRDPHLAHFRTEDVVRVEVAQPGQKPLVLARDKDKSRWKLEQPAAGDAESARVTELLDKLSNLSARDKDVIDKADPKEQGLDSPTTVTVTAEEEVKQAGDAAASGTDKERPKATKTFTFLLGKQDVKANKVYVRVEGWPRVNAVDGAVANLVHRPALAYRGRRVLDFDAADLDTMKIERPGEVLTLKLDGGKWKLAEPVSAAADSGKASQLAAELGRLDAVEYTADAVKADDLETQYGLGKPLLTATLTFRDGKKPGQTLLIGKQRKDKPDYYAKLADGDSVFVVTKEVRDSLDRPALAYRPLQLWQMPADQVAELRIKKEGQDEYRLARQEQGDGWKVIAPFQAEVQPGLARLMADELSNLRCERYEAHTVKDPAAYGLDRPYLQVTVVPKKDAGKEAKVYTLVIGKPVGEPGAGQRFARQADSDGVFVLGVPVVAAVDHGALDLLDRKLLALDHDRIKTIRVVTADAKLGLQRDPKGKWHVVESPTEPFPADGQAVDVLLEVWSNLRAQKFVAYSPGKEELGKYGLEKPGIKITVRLDRDGQEEDQTLELGKQVEGGAGERYARVNGGPAAAVIAAPTVATLSQDYLGYVNHTLLEIDPAAVEGLVRKAGADTLELAKRADGWHLVKPAEQRGDDATIQNLLRELTGRAVRVAEYPLKDAKSYGLAEPEAVLTLQLKAGDGQKEQVIRIGKPAGEPGAAATGDGGRFALVNDGKAVLVLPGDLSRLLVAGPLAFRDRTLAKFVDADRAVLTRGRRRAVFTKVDGTWKLTEPTAAEAEQTELDNLVNAVAELKASELVAEKPDAAALKQYGLDKPEAAWLFQSGDKEVLHLLLGNKDKLGRVYARLDNGELVFLLDAPLAKQLLAEYRSRGVWSPPSLDSAQAEALTYTRGAGSFTLEKGPDGAWKVAGKPDVKVKTEAVTDALAAVAGLKAERYVVDKDAQMKLFGLDPAELAIDVMTPSGKRTLYVGRNPDGEAKKYYGRVLDKDRTDVFVLPEADAARIVRDLPAFTQAPPKPEKQ